MRCPKCDAYYTKIVDTRERNEGHTVYRRRHCTSCGYRFSTHERKDTTKRERVESMNEIRNAIPVPELMAGLAEECSELAHAALKLRRVWDKTNPTPMTEDMAIERFYEEIADVRLYLNQIDVNVASIEEIMAEKEARWKSRISKMG